MSTVQRTTAVVLFAVGIIVLGIPGWWDVAPDFLKAILAIVGGLSLLAGSLWYAHLAAIEGEIDERQERIRYRAGWYSFWILIVSILVISQIDDSTSYLPSWLIPAVLVFWGGGVYGGLYLWFGRTM